VVRQRGREVGIPSHQRGQTAACLRGVASRHPEEEEEHTEMEGQVEGQPDDSGVLEVGTAGQEEGDGTAAASIADIAAAAAAAAVVVVVVAVVVAVADKIAAVGTRPAEEFNNRNELDAREV
jgi:hypothetical protein